MRVMAIVVLFILLNYGILHAQSGKRQRRSAGDSIAVSIEDVLFSPDGAFLLVEEKDRDAISLWDLKRKTKLFRKEFEYELVSKRFSSDGQYVLVQLEVPHGKAESIKAFSANTGKPHVLHGVRGYAIEQVSPDGKTELLSNAGKPGLALRRLAEPFDQSTGEKLKAWEGDDVAFGSTKVIFSERGQLVATCNRSSHSVVIWEAKPMKRIAEIPKENLPKSHVDDLYLEFSPSGKILVAIGNSHARWFDARQGTPRGQIRGTRDSFPTRFQFSPDDSVVIAFRDDRGFSAWDVSNGTSLFDLADSEAIAKISFDQQGKFATGIGVKFVQRWDMTTGKVVNQFSIPQKMITEDEAGSLSPTGDLLAVGLPSGEILLWKVGKSSDGVELLGQAVSKSLYSEIPIGKTIVFEVSKAFFRDRDGVQTPVPDGLYRQDNSDFRIVGGKRISQ